MDKYAQQDRGGAADYEEYFAGMDASMQQKIALTTAHFPVRGLVADMGSGSGSGTYDLARLYRHLRLVGVDINQVTVDYSNSHYVAENLKFVTGDISETIFDAQTLDAILDSSVLHHVTSFNDFDIRQIVKTLENQVAQLKTGGVLIVRDFVIPDDAEQKVFLDLPTTDGADSGTIEELSSAALFEVFARDFRSSANRDAPVRFEKIAAPRANFIRFQTALRFAAEFVLRKDYRDHWAPELLEEYTYCTQADFENLFKTNDLRIVVSQPLWNPWIVANRFEDKFYLFDADENPLHFPPTNFLIVGEKIAAHEGYQILEAGGENDEINFLKLKAYRHKATNQIFELAERPHQTIDLLPWYESADGQLFVLAKKDFPRPLVNAQRQHRHLNRANYSGYLTEPISAICDLRFAICDLEIPDSKTNCERQKTNHEQLTTNKGQRPKTEDQKPIFDILQERANLAEHEILTISEPNFYFTSPGGIDERVESFLVEIAPFEKEPQKIENYTKFVSAGTVRELDALQVLRASHVGGMFDARLEINIYRLLRQLNRPAGAWIGAEIKPETQAAPENLVICAAVDLSSAPTVQTFEPIELTENRFLKVEKSEFIEYDATGDHLAKADFEYVVPKNFSKNTVAALPFFVTETTALVAIETRDLPAPQRFTGSSRIFCAPAWRLPKEVEHKFELENFLRGKFPKDFGVSVVNAWDLGGSYFTSAGITPEIVYPLAVEIDARDAGETNLKFFHLKTLLENAERLQDAHLLIALNRLAHALGFC